MHQGSGEGEARKGKGAVGSELQVVSAGQKGLILA